VTPHQRNQNADPSQRVLVVFTRAPELGKVKTRLARRIGMEAALKVHLSLLENTLSRLCRTDRWITQLSYEGDLRRLQALPFVAESSVTFEQQRGSDLGGRMYHSIDALVSLGKQVVLVGSDCPVFDTAYIERAFQALESGLDVALGPAEDGGYVLVGMGAGHKGVFMNIDWGSQRVFAQTLERIQELGLTHLVLEVLWDVDTQEDLRRYEALCEN